MSPGAALNRPLVKSMVTREGRISDQMAEERLLRNTELIRERVQ